jgi:signal transduction histidine kinase/ligand-binding sensor domain-containing protein
MFSICIVSEIRHKPYFCYMRILLLFVFVSVFGTLNSQGMRFSHLDQKQGLSQNTPDCFLQDSEGFMWIGTQDGLNRYDGYTFTVLRSIPGDTNSLCDNFVLALTEDSENNIWIGTRNGICVYVKGENKFYRYRSVYDDPTDFHASVRNVAALNEGGVVYRTRTNHLISVQYDAGKHCVVATGLINEEGVYAIAYEKQTGDLAFLTKTHILIGLPGNQMVSYSIKIHLHGWISMILDGEHLYVNDSLDILHIPVHSKGMSEIIYTSDSRIACISKGPDKSIWLGTDNGLRVIYSPLNSPKVETVIENKEDYFGLNGNRTEAIYCSRENIVWIGTVGGINIYDPLQKRYTLLSGIFSTPSQDAVWFVMSVGDIVLWANDKGLMAHSATALPDWVNAIPMELSYSAGGFDSRNRLWLGTKKQGVVIIDTAANTVDTRYRFHTDFAESSVMDFCSIDGKMWIASIGSLIVADENELSLQIIRSKNYRVAGIPMTYFSTIATDEQDHIYVGTSKGIAILDRPDTNATWLLNDPANQNSLAYNIINDLMIIGGDMWIATMGSGLDRMNLTTGDFTHYSTSNGLANNTIYGIEPGSEDELWLSSNEGLIQFNSVNGNSRNFTMRDGLPSNEFVINKHSRATTSDDIYFGSSNGLVKFSPSDFQSTPASVLPVITRMTVNYKPRYQLAPDILELNSDERNISFEFAAIDFRTQDKINYSYKLEGFDTAWHNTGIAERSANFTNLPYGTYRFLVRYRIGSGVWSETMLEKKIVIATPFYATAWFRFLIVLLGVTIVALVVRYISQRKLRKQLEVLRVQEQIRNEKERISRDLHDNVGAQLTYVISTLDNLSYSLNKQNSTNKESAKLEQLGEFTRGTIDQLRESIWAINSDKISLSELCARWRQQLALLNESQPEFSGKVHLKCEDEILSPGAAIEIHRVVQEAITNAFKHSKGTQVEVNIERTSNQLKFSVRDNGIGMNGNSDKPGHYGMQNMRDRAKNLDGIISISTEPGTTIVLKIPRK